MFYKILKKNRFLYILSIISGFFATLSSIIFSIQLGKIIDAIKENKEVLLHRLIITSVLIAFNIFFSIIYSYFTKKYITKVLNSLKKRLFHSFYNIPLMNYSNKKEAQYLNLLTKDTELLLANYLQPRIEIFIEFFSAIMAIIALAYISIRLTIIFALISIINIVFSSLPSQYINKKTKMYSEKNKEYLEKTTNYLSGFEQIKLLNISNIFKEKTNNLDDDFEKNRLSYLFAKDLTRFFSISLSLISQMLSLGIGIYFALNGYLTIGMLLAAVQLLNSVFMPISNINNYINLIKTQKEIIDNIDKKLEMKTETLSNIDDKITNIKIDNLTLSFNNTNIFTDYSYEFKENTKYAIIGKSGRGKSTLVKLIMKYFQSDKYIGNILINGKNVKDINSDSIYTKIAFIQKNDFLINESIKDNILLGRNNKDISKILNILNLNSIIEKKENNVSVGEKQRIDLSRFLISDYDVLIFDEPTSNLDPETAKKVEEYILSLKDKIVIVITHNQDEQFLEKFDEIIKI